MLEDPARINHILDAIFSYGPFWVYAAIFAACFIENIFPPFPGDSFIAAAGALTAVSRLNFLAAMAVVVAGGIGSVMLIYLVGRNYGRDFFIKKNYKYLSADDILRAEQKFNRWGALILIVSRFVVGFRSVLALVAGISRYDARRMLVFSSVSYLLFTALLMYAASKLVKNLSAIADLFRTYNLVVWSVLIIVLSFYILRKFLTMRKSTQ